MTKKIIGLFLGLCLISSEIMAQDLSFGIDLGSNLMTIDNDDFGATYKPTFNGGAFVGYDFKMHFAITSGVYYSQKMHTNTQLDTGQLGLFGLESQLPEGVDVDLSTYSVERSRIAQYYLELPLLATYKNDWFNASIGPYVGYMLFARKRTFTSTTIPFLQAIDVAALDPTGGVLANFLPDPYTEDFSESSSTSGLNDWQFGLRAGMGIEVQNIGVNVAYNYGFLTHRSSVQTGDNKPYSYFQFSINYKLSSLILH